VDGAEENPGALPLALAALLMLQLHCTVAFQSCPLQTNSDLQDKILS
jgi:hypothetical protein